MKATKTKETSFPKPLNASPSPENQIGQKGIEKLSNFTFTNPIAIHVLNWSALGCLGFLNFLYYFNSFHPIFLLSTVFAGFFGLFGLVGIAFFLEFCSRSERAFFLIVLLTILIGLPVIGALGAGILSAIAYNPSPREDSIQTQATEPKEIKNKDHTKKAATAVVATTIATSAPAEELQPVDEAARTELKERSRERFRQDRDEYSRQELAQLEELYQVANKNWKTDKPKAKEAMEELVKNYKKANRTGCAMLYLAQLSRGDERDKYLDEAIKDYSDCFYGNGVQVGGWARFLRILDLRSDNKDAAADKLEKELRTDYPKAITHSGILLTDLLDQQEAKEVSSTRALPDSRVVPQRLMPKRPSSTSSPLAKVVSGHSARVSSLAFSLKGPKRNRFWRPTPCLS